MTTKKTKTKSRSPIAVLISDDHVSMKNLDPSLQALSAAVEAANELDVRLISAGDLHDTKSLHQSKCIRAIRDQLKLCDNKPLLLVGNHDRESEKSDDHALGCFEDLAFVINEKRAHLDPDTGLWMIPYCHDSDEFLAILKTVKDGSNLLVHQGVRGAFMGEYVVDRSSVDPTVFDRFNSVRSGHYHRHQTVGKFSYLGSPYTISAAEAQDGPKGIRILFDDFTDELLELDDIRKHVTIEATMAELKSLKFRVDTILWLKVHGTTAELSTIKKADLGEQIIGHGNFKLDRIATDSPEIEEKTEAKSLDGFNEIMHSMITKASSSTQVLWKELNETSNGSR